MSDTKQTPTPELVERVARAICCARSRCRLCKGLGEGGCFDLGLWEIEARAAYDTIIAAMPAPDAAKDAEWLCDACKCVHPAPKNAIRPNCPDCDATMRPTSIAQRKLEAQLAAKDMDIRALKKDLADYKADADLCADSWAKENGAGNILRAQLAAQTAQITALREALETIEAIGDGSKTVNILPNIAVIARAALNGLPRVRAQIKR